LHIQLNPKFNTIEERRFEVDRMRRYNSTEEANKKAKKKGKNRRNVNILNNTDKLPTNLRGSFPFPEKMLVELNAIFNFTCTAGLFYVADFALNDVYTFARTLGTTNDFSGTTQLANIYDSYHVEHATVSFQAVNTDNAYTVSVGLTFKDDQPGTSITTRAHAINALEVAPTTGPQILSTLYGQPLFRSKQWSFKLGAIVGNAQSYNSTLQYTSSFGSAPNQVLWMSFIYYSTDGTHTPTAPCDVQLKVKLRVKVYSIKVLQE